jgi:hypothetical protein
MSKDYLKLIFCFLLMVCVLTYSLYTIQHFMPIFATCTDEIEVINKCSCIPSQLLNSTLFIK